MRTGILDLIDFEKVDTLLEGFNKSTGFVTAILDLEGNVLSQSGWRQMCTEFHRSNPETAKRCRLSDTLLANKLAEGEKYHYYKCLNGLVDVAVPIIINEEHIANLFSGQFFFDKPDISFFKKQAEEFGFDETTYLESLKKIPVIAPEQAKSAMDFLLNMTQLISEMTFQKLEQINLNKALKESEERFHLLFQKAPLGYQSLDAEGHFIDINQQWLDELGYSREEVIGKWFGDFLTPDSKEEFKKLFPIFLSQGFIQCEFEMIRKDKSHLYFAFEGKIAHNSAGDFMQTHCILQNITESKKAENALKESEEKYRLLYTSMDQGLALHEIILDEDGKPVDYVFLDINYSYTRILGITREMSVGKRIKEIMPKVEEYWIDFFGKVALTGESGYYENYFETTGRHYSTYSYSPKKNQFAVLVNDITERKRVEKALQKSEENFKAIANFSASWEAWFDNHGKLLWTNPYCEKITGYTPDEYLATDDFIQMAVAKADAAMVKEKLIDALKGNSGDNLEIRCNHKNGSEVWVTVSWVSIFDSQGNNIGLRTSSADLTKRKQTELSLQESEEKYRVLFNTFPLGITITDSSGNIVESNARSSELLGLSKDEQEARRIDGEQWRIIRPDGTLMQTDEYASIRALKENRLIENVEMGIVKSHEKTTWINVNAAPLLLENYGVAVTYNDITDRKKTEEALRKSDERYALVVDATENGIWDWNVETNEVYFSEQWKNQIGYRDDEIKNEFDIWTEHLHPDEKDYCLNAVQNYLNNPVEHFFIEFRFRHKDGSYRWISNKAASVKNSLGKVIRMFGAHSDITETKKAEMIRLLQYNIANAVVTSKNLNELFDSIKDELNFIVDVKNFFIAFYNEETGMLRSLCDNDEKDQIPEWPAEKSATGYVIKQGKPALLRKADTIRLQNEGILKAVGIPAEAWLGVPLKIEGKVSGAMVVQSYDNPDIFDQSSIEILELIAHELSMFIENRRSGEKAVKLSKAVEQSSVSVMITNKDGYIEYVNPFFSKLTGYSFEEVLGKNPKFLKSGKQSNAFYETLWKTILSGNDWEGEILNKNKWGYQYWEKALISPIVNSEGVLTNFVAIKEDITERKKMLEELVAAKVKSEESDRLKTAFINNISHEIRTPLNGILGFGEFLTETNLPFEARKEMFKHVQRSSNRLMNTVSDYMDMARIVSGSLEVNRREFLLKPLLSDIYEKTKDLCAEKNIELEAIIPENPEVIILFSDRELIHKTVTILLNNALKFTKSGNIKFGFKLQKDIIEFFVQDTGRGIAHDKLDVVFNMFTQEDTSDTRGYEGSGLGLSIAKGLVALLGGDITVFSTKGIGSTFIFTVPNKSTYNGERSVFIKELSAPTAEKPLILVAEDEESNYLYIEIVLKNLGCDILHAINGAEAVEFCRRRPDISVVLMDIKMPVMNGLEATLLIHAIRPELPIIATTAFAQLGDEQRFLAAGCDDYLVKPFKKEMLVALLRKYL